MEQQGTANKQAGFLARLLRRRGGNSAGKADLKAPLAEAIGTGILTLAVGMMSTASSGLGGACLRRDWVGYCHDTHTHTPWHGFLC